MRKNEMESPLQISCRLIRINARPLGDLFVARKAHHNGAENPPVLDIKCGLCRKAATTKWAGAKRNHRFELLEMDHYIITI